MPYLLENQGTTITLFNEDFHPDDPKWLRNRLGQQEEEGLRIK